MIDSELRLFLLQHPGVSDLIGTRVYPALLPEDETLPAVVYSQVSYQERYSNSGSCHATARYQVDSYADSLNDVRQLDNAIRAVMSGFRGRWGKWSVTVFQRNTFSERLNDEEIWRVMSDYVIHTTV